MHREDLVFYVQDLAFVLGLLESVKVVGLEAPDLRNNPTDADDLAGEEFFHHEEVVFTFGAIVSVSKTSLGVLNPFFEHNGILREGGKPVAGVFQKLHQSRKIFLLNRSDDKQVLLHLVKSFFDDLTNLINIF